MQFIKQNISKYGISILCILYSILQFNYLNKAFYWDEAWSYFNDLTLFNKNIIFYNPETIKGHPPLFYLLSSIVGRIFGFTPFVLHSFCLVIALITATIFYRIISKYTETIYALLATIAILFQPVFFAQSTRLLPEILLACFGLLTYQSILNKNFYQQAIYGSLLATTKETGIVILFALQLFHFQSYKLLSYKNFLLLIVPYFAFSSFLLYNYLQKSWFLYPNHIALIREWSETLFQMVGYATFVFLAQGRNIGFFIFIIFCFVFRKNIIANFNFKILGIIIFYLIFSSFNFYSPRYSIVVILFWYLFFFTATLPLKKMYFVIAIICISIGNFWGLIYDKNENDYSLGMFDSINIQREAFKIKELQNASIYAKFLSATYGKNPQFGYVQQSLNISETFQEQDFILYSGNEENEIWENVTTPEKYTLFKTLSLGKSVIMVYKKQE